MAVIAWLIGVAAIGVIVGVGFGLLTGRLDWRAQGCCCPADPAKDLRMRDILDADPQRATDPQCAPGPHDHLIR